MKIKYIYNFKIGKEFCLLFFKYCYLKKKQKTFHPPETVINLAPKTWF